MPKSYVYIIGNDRPTIYIGITSNLIKRIFEHKNGVVSGFTERYNLKKLLHYEIFDDINDAIYREKQLKNWRRSWKLDLIKKKNPKFNDLYPEIIKN